MTFADGPRSPCTDRRPYRGVAHGYRAVGSAGGAGEAGRNDVGSVPIQRNTGAVIPHSGPRVTVRGGFLNVAQRHAGVEGCGDERVAQGVWADRLANAGPLGGPAHDPAGPGDSVEVGLRLHPTKTTVVYCKDGRRRGSYEHTDFTFLGFTFRARGARSKAGVNFTGFGPAISKHALNKVSAQVRRWRLHVHTGHTLAELARRINPIVRGWMQYYGAFNRTALYPLLRRINAYLVRWLRRKY